MADRIFAGFLLLVTLAYGFIAFTIIQAPFQYDPLGPESWPQILSVVAVLCILGVIWKPDTEHLGISAKTWFRMLAMIVLLFAYAELYEPLGFIISTILFGTVVARMLGAPWVRAALFGLGAGVLGWVLCVEILDLNLPDSDLLSKSYSNTEGTN
jgi:putative tricarboxylic transport membrane protein